VSHPRVHARIRARAAVAAVGHACRPWPTGLARGLVLLVLVAVLWVSLDLGVAMRRWAYDATVRIRFRSDISRGWDYGLRAHRDGYLDLYDRAGAVEHQTGRELHFNYGPFRLLTMRTWASMREAQAAAAQDRPDGWQEPHHFTAPVLRFNTTLELISCLGVFLLVRRWSTRRPRAPADEKPKDADPGPCRRMWRAWRTGWAPFRGVGLGLAAAGLLWFNPAVVLNAHGWPLWDIWIIPFFVWAVWLVTHGRWFAAGLLIAVGTMFKGQHMIVGPWFVLVPLFMGRPGAAYRWIGGFAFGFAACIGVWMLGVPYELAEKVAHAEANKIAIRDPASPWVNWPAVGWVLLAAAAGVTMGLRHWARRGDWRVWLPVAGVSGAAVFAAFLFYSESRWWWQAALALLALGNLAWWAPRRLHGVTVALCVAAALFACIPLFDASTGWFTFGFQRGTKVFPSLHVAHALNIPGILTGQFGFHERRSMDMVAFAVFGHDITLPALLKALYAVALAALSLGTARMLRAGDPRFLLGAAGAWLWMFLVLPQMHERYLLFASLISTLLLAIDWRFAVVTLYLSFATFLMTLRTMLDARGFARSFTVPEGGPFTPDDLKWAQRVTHEAFPGMAWGVVLCGLLVLFLVLVRPRRVEARRQPA